MQALDWEEEEKAHPARILRDVPKERQPDPGCPGSVLLTTKEETSYEQ